MYFKLMYVFFPHIRTIVKPKKVQVSVTWEEGPGECETDGSWAAWPSWGGFSVKEAAQPLPPPAGPGRWVGGPQNPQRRTEPSLWLGSVIFSFAFWVSLSHAGCILSSPCPLSWLTSACPSSPSLPVWTHASPVLSLRQRSSGRGRGDKGGCLPGPLSPARLACSS